MKHAFAALLLLLFAHRAMTQSPAGEFAATFADAHQKHDGATMRRAVEQAPDAAWRHHQELRLRARRGDPRDGAQLAPLQQSWRDVFGGNAALGHIDRWLEQQTDQGLIAFARAQDAALAAQNRCAAALQAPARHELVEVAAQLAAAARIMETFGHRLEAAELWNSAALAWHRLPSRSLDERSHTIETMQRYVACRHAWGHTGDAAFQQNRSFLACEQQELVRAQRRSGVPRHGGRIDLEALLLPDAAAVSPLEFAALPAWQNERDWCHRGGAIPAYWWSASFAGNTTSCELWWFERAELHLVRTGEREFGITAAPGRPEYTQRIAASAAAPGTVFQLDPDGRARYAMHFWVGGAAERIGQTEVDLGPNALTGVFCRSAASWHCQIAGEKVVFYDDNCNGWPMDADPAAVAGATAGIGTIAVEAGTTADQPPLLDSMRIGKGPRVPFSQLAKIGAHWLHLQRNATGEVESRRIDPAKCRFGRVRLQWQGPRATVPDQLVIQGLGDLRTAFFDLAGGQPVEVPAGEYGVVWGRIEHGKGAERIQATVHGLAAAGFTVEADRTFTLQMGTPFQLDFRRDGTDASVSIDAMSIALRERSGCSIVDLHGMVLAPQVLAADDSKGRSARPIGRFDAMSDGRFVSAAAGRNVRLGLLVACLPQPAGSDDGELVLTVPLPRRSWVGLQIAQHAVFGALRSEWR